MATKYEFYLKKSLCLTPNISIDELRTNPVCLFLPIATFLDKRHTLFDSHKDTITPKRPFELLKDHPQKDQRLFLYGMELLNAHFWEAHETLEFLWLKADGEQRELLQATHQKCSLFTQTAHGSYRRC